MVQRFCGASIAAAGTLGTDNSEEGIVGEENFDGEMVGKEVGYEETDFLDGSSSTQETKKSANLVVVTMVTKSLNSA